MKNSKLDQVLEGFKPIASKRFFYPRGMKLSDSFVDAFHTEYDRLVGEGLNPKSLCDRFGKALRFHVKETRRYKAPVVETCHNKKEKDIRDDVNKLEKDPHEGDRGEAKRGGKKPTKQSRHSKNVDKWSKDQS